MGMTQLVELGEKDWEVEGMEQEEEKEQEED